MRSLTTPTTRSPPAGGFTGDDFCDVQGGQRQCRSGLFQRDVRGVVRAEKELRTGPREAGGALRQREAHGRVVSALPRRHAAAQRDAVERDIGVFVRPQSPKAFLAERPQALGRTFDAMREYSGVAHPAKAPCATRRPRRAMRWPAGTR
jgi:hypothetical protein